MAVLAAGVLGGCGQEGGWTRRMHDPPGLLTGWRLSGHRQASASCRVGLPLGLLEGPQDTVTSFPSRGSVDAAMSFVTQLQKPRDLISVTPYWLHSSALLHVGGYTGMWVPGGEGCWGHLGAWLPCPLWLCFLKGDVKTSVCSIVVRSRDDIGKTIRRGAWHGTDTQKSLSSFGSKIRGGGVITPT